MAKTPEEISRLAPPGVPMFMRDRKPEPKAGLEVNL